MIIVEPKLTSKELDGKTFNYFNNVISTNVPTSTNPEWDSNKTDYKIEDVIYNPTLQREYICGVDGSRAKPWLSADWKDIGAENNALMHDQSLFTKTEYTDDIVVEYQTRFENYLMFFGLENITSIHIEQRLLDTDELIKEETLELRDYGVDTWIEYAYTDTVDKQNFAYSLEGDRPAKVKVTFVGATDSIRKIGAVIVGQSFDYGCVLVGASVKTDNLAKFVDNGQVTYFKGKGVVKSLSGTLTVPMTEVEKLDKKLDSLAGSLSVYWLNDDKCTDGIGMVLGYSEGHEFPVTNSSIRESQFNIVGIK